MRILEKNRHQNSVSDMRVSTIRMRRSDAKTGQRAFTLIELLVVIAIIAILAAMLLPVLSVAMTHAKKVQAKVDVSNITTAVERYDSQYSRMPAPSWVQQSGSNNVTYGGSYSSASVPGGVFPPTNSDAADGGWHLGYEGCDWTGGIYDDNYAEIMAILLDLTNYPNSTQWTVNTNYEKNPAQTIFLNGRFTGDTVSHGIGTDLSFRDPWGNPYLITMDLNEDNNVADPFYALAAVSSSTGTAGDAGVYGLNYNKADGLYHFHGNVVVWSMGPNGPYNHSPSSFTYPQGGMGPSPATKAWALDPSNKSHILGWVQ